MPALTEREKMLAGQLYLGSDPELAAMRARALRLSRAHEQADGEAERRRIVEELLGSVGANAIVTPTFRCDYGSHIFAGANLYMNFGCVILDCARVTIGDDVMFGPYVQIYTAHHPLNPEARAAGPELATPITIGSGVWIGGGAIVLPGVTIGDGCTIGAGSVVTRDVPPRMVAAGNPCRVLRPVD